MSSTLESDVCCRLQVAPSGESYGGNRRPSESNGSLHPGLRRDSLHVTCGLTACTPGSAPGPTLGNEYGKTLPFLASSAPKIWHGPQNVEMSHVTTPTPVSFVPSHYGNRKRNSHFVPGPTGRAHRTILCKTA